MLVVPVKQHIHSEFGRQVEALNEVVGLGVRSPLNLQCASFSLAGAFVALAVVAEPEPALQRFAVYDAYLFLVRNRAIAELEESTQPAEVGFFQLCGSKCGKQIASKVFYSRLGKQPITGKRALARY